MTLRDLTTDQLDAGVKRCTKEREAWFKQHVHNTSLNTNGDFDSIWNSAYNSGFKAGLSIERPPSVSNKP